MKLGSLCSGAGGLDLAVERVFGAQTVWHCEQDAAASKALSYRWPGVPNHGDLIATDWAQAEPVDIICAGWPCQPFSLAGKRKGHEDERAIWPYIARAVRILRPAVCVMENVGAVLRSAEFTRVANDMAALGYDLRWTCLRASDVGAPHRRERLFVVAVASGAAIRKPTRGSLTEETWTETGNGSGDHSGEQPNRNGRVVADAAGDGRHEGRPEPTRQQWGFDAAVSGDGPGEVRLLPTPTSRDHKGQNQRGDDTCLPGGIARDFGGQWGKYAPAIHRWEQVAGPAPSPTELNRNGNPRLNPAFSEWMMGWPAGWVTDVPGLSRNDQLRIIGNGVMPQQAEAALYQLLAREVSA